MLTIYPSAPLPNYTRGNPQRLCYMLLMHASMCESLLKVCESHLQHAGVGALDAGSLIMQALNVSAQLVQVA